MSQFTVNNCCFCITLKIGCYFIALLCLVFDLILGFAEAYRSVAKHHSMLWIGAGFYFVNSVLDIMLLYGMKKGKKRLMWAWVWLNGIFLGLDVIFIIFCISFGWLSILMILFALFIVVLKLYAILVVRSYIYSLQPEIDILP